MVHVHISCVIQFPERGVDVKDGQAQNMHATTCHYAGDLGRPEVVMHPRLTAGMRVGSVVVDVEYAWSGKLPHAQQATAIWSTNTGTVVQKQRDYRRL